MVHTDIGNRVNRDRQVPRTATVGIMPSCVFRGRLLRRDGGAKRFAERSFSVGCSMTTGRGSCSISTDAATVLWSSGRRAEGLSLAFRDNRAEMYAAARRIVGNEHVADVAQEVLLRLWTFPDRFDPTRTTLGNYLRVVNRSVAVDQLRNRVARRRREDLIHWIDVRQHPDVSAAAIEREHAARINAALLSIPGPERAALVCAFFGQMTYAEAAVELGIPEGTIKSRIRRGIAHLRYELRDLP